MDMTQNTVSLQETQKWYLEYLGGHLPDLAPTTPLAKADTKIQTQKHTPSKRHVSLITTTYFVFSHNHPTPT
jgi:hypothetical protein